MRKGKRNERTHLKPADQDVADLILEKLTPLVVLTTPAPKILSVTIRLAAVEYPSTDAPHDDAKDEDDDGENSIVDCCLFRSPVTMSPMRIYDGQ